MKPSYTAGGQACIPPSDVAAQGRHKRFCGGCSLSESAVAKYRREIEEILGRDNK